VTAADLVLPVDKPIGPTSHDIVATARRALQVRRIGHTGTLDPFASGLLLLCVGRATRLAEYLTGLDKSYEAVARLGQATDTEDCQGEVIQEQAGWEVLSESDIQAAMQSFTGPIDQVPPQYSAKKVDGVAMHRRARRGEHVVLEARAVTVHEIELLKVDLPFVRFRVNCSSGTYVRSLARDIGEALGVGGHLTELRRTSVGKFSLDGALSPDDLFDSHRIEGAAIEPLQAMAHMPTVVVSHEDVTRLAHGQDVQVGASSPSGTVAVVHDGKLVAVANIQDGLLRPAKVFIA
jgi:tRNA pseudouridine55 synthase